MRVSLFTVLLTLSMTIGCNGGNGGKRPPVEDPTKNAEDRFETLRELNRLVSENQEAIAEVFPDEAKGRANEKVGKMADLIRKGQCRPNGKRPTQDLDHSWTMDFEVNSENCPIRLLENWDYDHESRTWKKSQLFSIRSDAYRELNTVESMDGSGTIWAEEKKGTVHVQGHFSFKEFRVMGLGNLTYEINTNQEYPGLNRGSGRIDMYLRHSNEWQASASIEWSFPDFQPIYRVNGKKLEEKAFLEMFSAYGLTEIMYLSLDMR